MTENIDDVRRSIQQMFERSESQNFYELLSVERDASSKDISSAYRQLARQWHVDRYNKFDLGDDKQKLQAVFAALNNAQRTLTDDSKRKEYDASLDSDGVDATDVVNIFNADKLFLRGKTFLQQGSYKGAYEQFSEAHKLNPQDQDIYIYMLYAEYLQIPKNPEGAPRAKTRAQEIHDEFEKILAARGDLDWLMVFLGVVKVGMGQNNKAYALFRDALLTNPKNADAKRQVRMMKMKQEREKNDQGLWEKIKSAFRS